MELLTGLLLAGFVLLSVSLLRVYGRIPARELKRRARQGDQTAALLHQAAVYGSSLRAILWFLIGLSVAGFFTYMVLHVSVRTALITGSLLVWIGFAWLPNREVRRINIWFAKVLAPPLAWILQYAHSPLSWTASFLQRHRPVTIHTGLYDKEDLLSLINSQNVQVDNRIEQHELELAYRALTFGDKVVGDYLTPRRIVKTVSVEETIGPVVMAELHDSGFSRFPVYEDKKDNIVGTLYLRDLIRTKSSAKVKSVMRREVVYVHEEQSLHDALQAVLRTRNHLLVVVNNFEEFMGVLSFEDILEQLIGQAVLDEFDQYDDLRAVAQRAASKEHKDHTDTSSQIHDNATAPSE